MISAIPKRTLFIVSFNILHPSSTCTHYTTVSISLKYKSVLPCSNNLSVNSIMFLPSYRAQRSHRMCLCCSSLCRVIITKCSLPTTDPSGNVGHAVMLRKLKGKITARKQPQGRRFYRYPLFSRQSGIRSLEFHFLFAPVPVPFRSSIAKCY